MLDFDAIHETAKAQTEARSAEFWSVVGRLREEPQFKEAAETAFGVDIDVSNEEGIQRFLALVNNLGDKAEARIDEEVQRLRIRDEAAKRYAASKAEATEVPEGASFSDFLKMDFGPDEFIIDGLMPRGGNIVFSAQRKAGKSTVVHNLIRSLVDGDPFLGYFGVTEPRRVALIDTELAPGLLKSWLQDHGIKNPDRLGVWNMKGRASAFNILDDAIRAKWVEVLRGYDVLILDPLRPVLDSLGVNEWNETGPFLQAFDALKREAGISEGMIVQHHGHHAQRAAGDSRLQGWPEAMWELTRDDVEDVRSPRWFSAYGRDVDADPGLLTMGDHRALSYSDTPKGVSLDGVHADALVTFLEANPGAKKDAILAAKIKGINSKTFTRIKDLAEQAGRIRFETNEYNAKLYFTT